MNGTKSLFENEEVNLKEQQGNAGSLSTDWSTEKAKRRTLLTTDPSLYCALYPNY